MKIENILVVPKATFKQSYPSDRLDVIFAPYKGSYTFDKKNLHKIWQNYVKPATEWQVIHKAAGTRKDRRFVNYSDASKQYPSLFEQYRALGQGVNSVVLIKNTLVISGQTPQDIETFFQTGQIPTKYGQKFILK